MRLRGAIFLAAVFAAVVQAAPVSTAVDRQLLDDARDGKWDRHSLVEAALIASGVHDRTEVARLAAQWRSQRQQLLGDAPAAPLDLHAALHQRSLVGGYQKQANLLQATLADGRYNCVTATILYRSLCRSAGVESAAISVEGHVFVRAGADRTVIETTCSQWSDNDRSPHVGRSERPISDVQLVAKIYYNRALEAAADDDFPLAVKLCRASLALDPHDPAGRENLLSALNNWSLQLCGQQRYAEALDRILTGLKINPHYAPLLANDLYVHQQWANSLHGRGRYEEAVALFETAHARRPDAAYFDEGRWFMYRHWINSLRSAGKDSQAKRVLRRAADRLFANPAVAVEIDQLRQ